MVKPARFGFNRQTAETNAFQKDNSGGKDVHEQAIAEFMQMVERLDTKGIEVLVFESDDGDAPDAIFPNNWFSTHSNGTFILYPMFAENRRRERHPRAIEMIKKNFSAKHMVDLSGREKENLFLEGTGSIVFDHGSRIAYAALSPRTDKTLLNEVCASISYKALPYSCKDSGGMDFYHTNVILHIGNQYAVLYELGIENQDEKKLVGNTLRESEKEVLSISPEQVSAFCGNMLQVRNKKGDHFLLCSETAIKAFHPSQIKILERFSEILPFRIPTIEQIGGGGVRCMVAELF